METILITGAGPNGVTGRRIKEYFQGKYNLLTPSSQELDLRITEEVDAFFKLHRIDFVIHCAVLYPKDTKSFISKDDNMMMFQNIIQHSKEFRKLFYFGSGAEYDKRYNITAVKEEMIGYNTPIDLYGYSKFLMNQYARDSQNIYNLRLFGTINPYEKYTKNVISNLCAKAVKKAPISLRKDCVFSFIDIDDVSRFIEYGLNNDLKYHDYNFTSERPFFLSGIATLIKLIAGNSSKVIIEDQSSLNNDYYGLNTRLCEEFSKFTPITDSLRKVFNFWKEHENIISVNNIDNRWNK